MNILLHKNATTTPRIRQEIRVSPELKTAVQN